MKKLFLLFAALIAAPGLFAQNKVNLVVFSEDGDPFYAYINGIRQNDKPETNVKVTGVSPNISLRIVFENKTLPELKQSMSLEPGYEHTARIKKDTKQQVKLRYFGQTPINDEPSPGVATVAYHTTENAPANVASDMSSGGAATTSYSTTTTTTTRSNPDGATINVNMGGIGMNMNVTTTETSNSQVTSTSSTTMSGTGATYESSSSRHERHSDAAPAPAVSSGCAGAMSPSSFAEMKKNIESKPFSETRMSTAKVATKNACLSVGQVKEICKLFSMDEDKLTYAKYAYTSCVDKTNYYQVSDVFSFSSTTDEFNKFLEQ